MTALSVLREGEATAWFADWLLSDPPPGTEVIPPVITDTTAPRIVIKGTAVKRAGKVWVLTGRKWTSYWEGKWPD